MLCHPIPLHHGEDPPSNASPSTVASPASWSEAKSWLFINDSGCGTLLQQHKADVDKVLLKQPIKYCRGESHLRKIAHNEVNQLRSIGKIMLYLRDAVGNEFSSNTSSDKGNGLFEETLWQILI